MRNFASPHKWTKVKQPLFPFLKKTSMIALIMQQLKYISASNFDSSYAQFLQTQKSPLEDFSLPVSGSGMA
jgi:hypothetical protein